MAMLCCKSSVNQRDILRYARKSFTDAFHTYTYMPEFRYDYYDALQSLLTDAMHAPVCTYVKML
jgi:hypothetical protein